MFAAVRAHGGIADDPDLAALVSIDSTSIRAHQHARPARALRTTQGAQSNYTIWPMNPLITPWDAPAGDGRPKSMPSLMPIARR